MAVKVHLSTGKVRKQVLKLNEVDVDSHLKRFPNWELNAIFVIFLVDDTVTPNTCVIKEEDLVQDLRVLVKLDGHFHPGKIQAISPPDIYGVLVDKERGNKPHIFSREEVLREAVSQNLFAHLDYKQTNFFIALLRIHK